MVAGKINLICLYCNSSFNKFPSENNKKYCSRKCYHDDRIGKTTSLKGKKYEDIYGCEEAEIKKEKIRKALFEGEYGFKKGHPCYSVETQFKKGQKRSKEVIDKFKNTMKIKYENGYINSMKGKIPHNKNKSCPELIKEKISDTLLRKYKTGEIKPWNKGQNKEGNESIKRISEKMKNRKYTDETIEKMRLKRNIFLNSHPDFIKFLSENTRKQMSNSENRKRLSITAKERWKDDNYKEKWIKALFSKIRPTGLEKRFNRIIQKHNLPYKYVGDGSFLIGYKNPDFINTNGEKIAIEVYYKFHKEQSYGSEERYKEQRNKLFSKYGWKTLFFEFDDIMKNEENIVRCLKL